MHGTVRHSANQRFWNCNREFPEGICRPPTSRINCCGEIRSIRPEETDCASPNLSVSPYLPIRLAHRFRLSLVMARDDIKTRQPKVGNAALFFRIPRNGAFAVWKQKLLRCRPARTMLARGLRLLQ